MEEAVAADLVLHVIDGSHPQFDEQRDVGHEVLADLGVDMDRVVEVYNKIDVEDGQSGLSGVRQARLPVLHVSALTGEGIDKLIDVIRMREREGGEMMQLEVPHEESRVAAMLHEVAEVVEQTVTDRARIFRAWVPESAVHLFQAYSAESLLEIAKAN